tara:strand:- start:1420 stop:2301 length:882 start_codon:yes stop_codon:yes gene_type:complete
LSRNNDDRLTPTTGATQDASTETPTAALNSATVPESGSPFSFVAPTEYVELPSRGDFYPEGHILNGVETVEIRQMTAKDEDILTSRALLKKGVALDKMINNLLVDKRINPDDMMIGDKNAIIVAARASGYGPEYTTRVTCPNCAEASENTFDLSQVGITEAADGLPGVTREGPYFNIELPQSKVVVKVKMMTGRDEQRFARNNRINKKAGVNNQITLTSQMRNFIVSANGDSTAKNLAYLVDHMPARDSRFLRTMYKAITPNVDMTQTFECPECDYTSELEVPFTTDFFWPDR